MTATTKYKKPPPINQVSKGLASMKGLCFDNENSLYLMAGAGTPVDGVVGTGTGAGFAGPGSLYIDITTPKIYINGGAGTKASPVWKIVTSA